MIANAMHMLYQGSNTNNTSRQLGRHLTKVYQGAARGTFADLIAGRDQRQALNYARSCTSPG